jgi:hypothetical protein
MRQWASGVAARTSYKRNGWRVHRLAAAAIALSLAAGLPGCSSDPGWPALGKVSDLGNILTPEERQKAVQDMQKTDQANPAGTPAKQGQ